VRYLLKDIDYRGALRLLILYVLSRGPMHGYEIMKEFEKLFGRAPGPGALYPQLRYLRQKGLVDLEITYKGSRKLKIYKITNEGLKFLEKNSEELEKILEHIKSAKAILDLGLRRVADDITKVIDLYPRLSPSDREKLSGILRRFSRELEEIISKYS
jgi:DNA-binding PadR family transcriptional regulator